MYLLPQPEHNMAGVVDSLEFFTAKKCSFKECFLFTPRSHGKLPVYKNINIYNKEIKSSLLVGSINR